MSIGRIYLDYNASAPLTEPCKKAMIETMGHFGNASSIHLEGRRSRYLIENSRDRIAESLGAKPENLVFTSGATEGASLLLRGKQYYCAEIEHSCVRHWCENSLIVSKSGEIKPSELSQVSVQMANSETGVLQNLEKGLYMSDVVQAVGKMKFSFKDSGIRSAIISAHKIGGPQGIGAVITDDNLEIEPLFKGGGQEKGRRAGTENVTSIVGFDAAINFAKTQLDDGVWEKVKELRDFLEDELANGSQDTIFVGKGGSRLPNTTCMLTPGWTGQMQVMQMDLAGFSISTGSACTSGKINRSRTLSAMGFSPEMADCSIRVSLGPKTSRAEIELFVREWLKCKPFKTTQVA